jgi:hypothetical protein
VADNNICQSGTTCVATGEDRRLGDFFTNAIDERGCAIIGTGDSTTKDPVTGGERNIALPLFVRQSSGPALRGGGDCSGAPASLLAGGVKGARAGQCVGRRSLHVRVRPRLGRDRLVRATIYLNGRPVKRLGAQRLRNRRLRVRIDLRGLPEGAFTVTVQGRTRKGRQVRDVRHYRTCTPTPRR